MINLSKVSLKDKINNILEYYNKYKNEDRENKLNKIKLYLDNQEYKIAVVANMSSGKSTFINALFGEEVLPAFNHATTDCATYIYSKPNIEKKAVIYFSDKKNLVTITDNLEEIKQYAQKDDECKDKKYKNVEKIELYYPFKYLQTSSYEDFSITFIDTPGPNSTGENYKQKHKDQTRRVLNDVDLALFMFDYTQLDANLSSDEQGLWNTIKKRYDKDRKNFDVYFLINKIDFALDDNFKEIDTKNKDEFIELKKKNWKIYENIAIEKIKKAAEKHDISNPQVYPLSSKFQLLSRDYNKNWDAEDELEVFQKSHFKRLFENWEEEYIKYLGIEKLEKDINEYINSNVKEKILKKVYSQLKTISLDEKNYLQTRLQTLQKPKDEAEENVEKAQSFLKNKADKLEAQFKDETLNIQRRYIKDIKKIIDNNIENEIKKHIPEATKRTILFLEELLEGDSYNNAVNAAKNLPQENINDYKGNVKITLKSKVEVERIEKDLQNFIKSILNDYKNNYLDMKIEIKNNFRDLSKEIGNLFAEYKRKFVQSIDTSLNISKVDFDEDSLYEESFFQVDIEVPDSTLDYKYRSAEWRDGGSFSGREKVRDEKHEIIISVDNIEKIYNLSVASLKKTFYDKEIETYKNTIVDFIKKYRDTFNDFKELKKREIEKLQQDLKNHKKELEIVEKQYNFFKEKEVQ